jgi:malonyl-CoA O-methyltransferase
LEERKLELLLPDARERTVIDLGCGTGRWLRKFLRRGARSVWGVDFTPQMLQRAAGDLQLKNQLVLGDCLFLPFRSQLADLVVCSFTLGHIRDLDTLAKEIARVSRPQAEVFVSDLHPGAQAAGWRCAFRYRGNRFEIEGHQHARARVQAAFRSAGFALRQSLDCFVGEAERHIFIQGGKTAMFETARSVPALAIDHFALTTDLNRGVGANLDRPGKDRSRAAHSQHQDSKALSNTKSTDGADAELQSHPGFFSLGVCPAFVLKGRIRIRPAVKVR